MVRARERPQPAGVIDLFGLRDLCGVREMEGSLWLGAATTYGDLLRSAPVRQVLPGLWRAIAEIGAVQTQERGTLGGNLGTSSPAGDCLPVLLALDATVELVSVHGVRAVPYREFCVGYRKTALAVGEVIAAVRVPRPKSGVLQFWRKVGTRRAQAISKVMVAAVLEREGERISGVRIGLGAVADRPVRALHVERVLHGAVVGPELEAAVRAAVLQDISPIDDVRSTASYRTAVAQNLLVALGSGRLAVSAAGS
jgi:CO/xanthine dehydrogenase FAD-binding subunit